VSGDKKQTSVGTGNKWLDVYSVLEPKGLSVVGGRVADIGVGGLTLGGGISFFSARFGWACDNVNTYEVRESESQQFSPIFSLIVYLGCICRRIYSSSVVLDISRPVLCPSGRIE
jgi:hypothetical protein